MKIKFRISRVLILVAVVLFLSFVYFMVRAGYNTRLDNVTSPIRAQGRVENPEDYSPFYAENKYLVIEDKEDTVSVQIRDAVELALESLGQEPVYSQNPSLKEINSGWEGIIITCTYLKNIERLNDLFDYAQNGGFLIFAVRPEVDEVFKSCYQKLGVYEHFYFKDSDGIHLQPGFLSDGEFDIEGDWLYNSIIELHVREECNVIAKNDQGVPLIWTLNFGRGNVLFMNNSLMTYKSTGGLLLSLIADVKGPLMYPVINAKAFGLESFPLPLDVNQDFLKSEYLRSGRAFLRDVWWPEMVRLGTANNIKYTGGFLLSYTDENPISSISVLLEEMDFAYYMKEISRYSGELAFTGFNQKPLYFGKLDSTMTFEPWSDEKTAQQRVKESLNFVDSYMPDYGVYTYMPPERVMDEGGYETIVNTMESLEVICGDFTDRLRYYQDFTVDKNGITEFPVVTEGFTADDMDKWEIINVSTAKGVVFHSCDVSDLLLETDTNKSWNKMSVDFSDFCSEYIGGSVFDSLTVTQAAGRVRDMLGMDAKITYDGSRIDIKIDNMPEKASFILLSFEGEPENIPGVICTKIHGSKYLITTTVAEFTLELS